MRARLIEAEGQPGTLSTVAFAGAVATAIFGIANSAGTWTPRTAVRREAAPAV